MSWTPTGEFLHGRLIRAFLPLEKHPNLSDENFKNLYPGDEVYIFETKNGKWARGYSLTRPFPSEFCVTSINLDDLPGLNVKIVIFPLNYVKLVEKLPLNMGPVSSGAFKNPRFSMVLKPAMTDVELVETGLGLVNGARNGDNAVSAQAAVPPLPYESFTFAGEVVDEITYAMNLLTAHIFELYSMGEFRLFNKLFDIYKKLDEMRVKLTHETLTQDEARLTRETVTSLVSSIPKNLASRAARSNEECYDLDNEHTDISAYKSILARETASGNLLSLNNVLPSQLALNQELCALLPKFPINAHFDQQKYLVKPQLNKKLSHEPPSHILVDFQSVTGSSGHQPSGFAGMIAYLYIRNAKKRLTEAFAVHTDSVQQLLFVEKILAAFFRNIPAAEVENNRIFLVAILTEEINLRAKDIKIPQIKKIKKGVAAGVTDITRVFSRNQNSLTSGESHQFSIRLFGSYVSSSKKVDPTRIENNGWGEVIDRIIKNTNLGVAINPRAEKLVVYVKEFKNEQGVIDKRSMLDSKQYDINADTKDSEPIAKIWPIFFDPLAETYERLYLKLGKLMLAGQGQVGKGEILTVVVSAPNNSALHFAKASNQIEKNNWHFVSVFSGEVIGEIVKISGLDTKAKQTVSSDHLLLTLYSNGVYAGEGKLPYKNNGQIVSYNDKNFHEVVITHRQLKVPIAELQVHTEYVGKQFNVEPAVHHVLNYGEFLSRGHKGLDELVQHMAELSQLDLANVVKFFRELMDALLNLAETCLSHSENGFQIVLDYCFKCIVHILDTLFGRQDQYLYLFDQYLRASLFGASVGVFLLNKLALVFLVAKTEWNSSSRSSCRVLSLLVQLSLCASRQMANKESFVAALAKLCDSASQFVANDSPILVNDQILVLELPDFISHYEDEFDPHSLLQIIVKFIDSVGTKGLGFDEERLTGRRPVQATKDHLVCITKLLVIQRLFARKFVREPALAAVLVAKSVSWAMDMLLGPMDIDTTRLAALIMNCVCDLVSSLLEDPESSNNGMKNVCFSLTKHLGVMARTFIKYNKFLKGNDYFKPKKSFTQFFQNSYPFVETVCDPVVGEERVVEVLVELAVVFVYMARLGKRAAGSQGLYIIHTTSIPNDFYNSAKLNSSNGLSEEMSVTLSGIQLIRQGHFFPEERWLSLYAVISEGCLLALELLAPLMRVHFVPDIDHPELFDRSLWGKFLRNLLRVSVLAPVSLEHLSTLPRKACYQITSTVRDRAAAVLSDTWDALAWDATADDNERFGLARFGGYQVEFIGLDFGILPDLMLFALQRNRACQSVAVKVLWSIIVSEYILSDSVVDVEKECLIGLHAIYNRAAYKPAINEQRLFVEELKAEIQLDSEDEALAVFVKFVRNLMGFLDILNDLNTVPAGLQFEDDRTFHKLKINAYLKEANKPELFNSFVHQMYEENVEKKDYVQAALSLELLAATFEWDHLELLPPSYRPKFPQQSAFERKESLVKLIAHNYVKGNSLERATDTYNELLEAYNQHTLDLKSFAYVHQKLAKLYLDMESSDKISPSYFKVAYIGNGFPTNIRGKELIMEGMPFEHITAVHDRLLRVFPGASIVLSEEQLIEIQKKPQAGRFIHVVGVEPVDEISDKILNTSIGERQYARNKNLRSFSTVKKIPGATSVFDLWTEEVTYETDVSFPTLMNRSEIVRSAVVRLSPLENAIRSILNKSTEIVQLESLINASYTDKMDYTSLLNDLSRQLAGTVDSPVNGGVGQYRTFFTDPMYDGKPDYAYNVRLLRNSFHDLAVLLNRCLQLHGKLVAPAMRSSHEVLVELFKKNFKDEIETLKLKTDLDFLAYNHAAARAGINTSTSLVTGKERLNLDANSTNSPSLTSRDSSFTDFSKNRRSALYWKLRGIVRS